MVGMVAYLTVHTALSLELSAWVTPVFVLAIFGNCVYWIWKLFRVK